MRNTISAILLVCFLMAAPSLIAQAPISGDEPVQMADTMRSNGKIYVVVAVIATIIAGVLIYLIRLDVKISRLEKQA